MVLAIRYCLGNFSCILNFSHVKIGWVVHSSETDELDGLGRCLCLDDSTLFSLSGLLDLILGSLGFLLSHLFGFNGFQILFHEGEIGDSQIVDDNVEMGSPLGEQSPDPIRNLVSLGEKLIGRKLSDHSPQNLITDSRQDLIFVILA